MKYFSGGVCHARKRLDGQVAIVTGSNTGIGLETVAELARRGCTVVMACRNMEKMTEAKKTILERYGNVDGLSKNLCKEFNISEDITVVKSEQILTYLVDLSSIQSIRDFVKEFSGFYEKLDLLICNAGVMMCPYSKTEDGFEMQMGTNHLGHFVLTELLIPLVKSSDGRIILVSSLAHYHGQLDMNKLFFNQTDYSPRQAYCNSKLANVMYAKNLAKRFGDDGPLVMSLHPGVIRTDLARHFNPVLRKIAFGIGHVIMKNAWQGAQTTLHCALASKYDLVQGGYYSDCMLKKPLSLAEDEKFVEELTKQTYKSVQLTEAGKDLFNT